MAAVTVTAAQVEANLAAVRARIARAGGDPGAIDVVAVTKQQPDASVRAALAAGLVDLGENRADGLLSRLGVVDADAVRWHYLGAIQRNKIARLAPHVALWQSVDRAVLGPAIARHAPGASVLVEVNLTDDPRRAGASLGEVPALVADLRAEGLDVRGVMAVGPLGQPEDARPGFLAVARCADELGLAVRSLGMSADIEVAVECGTTMVRLGTALLGARSHAPRSGAPRHVH